ncbi:LppU/SCO3897 family protein, partial [Saccharothrix lopnurensis]
TTPSVGGDAGGGGGRAPPAAGVGGSAAAGPAGAADPGASGGGVPPARPVGEVEPGPGASVPGVAPADSIDDSVPGPATPAPPTPAQAAPAPTPADPGSAATPRAGDGDEPSGKGRKLLIVAAIVVLAAVVVFGVVRLTGGGSTEAGSCVDVTSEFEDNPEVKGLDCDDDQASFKIGAVVEGVDATCPEDGIYSEVAEGDGGRKLCLLPNMVEGACYRAEESGTGFDKSECVGPETIKVTRVIQGSTDLEACPDSAGMAYPEPAVTYCLAPAEE